MTITVIEKSNSFQSCLGFAYNFIASVERSRIMVDIISDTDINQYISEPKHIDKKFRERFHPNNLETINGYKRKKVVVVGRSGSRFKIHYRENPNRPFDFCVGLYLIQLRTNREFILTRYNGKHRHRNDKNSPRIYDFHIHRATERGQIECLTEEKYAEVTNRYNTAQQALDCLLADCGFYSDQPSLSQWGEF
jgi:hypothetical protein